MWIESLVRSSASSCSVIAVMPPTIDSVDEATDNILQLVKQPWDLSHPDQIRGFEAHALLATFPALVAPNSTPAPNV